MNLVIRPILTQYISQIWPLVEKYIAAAEEFDGEDYTVEQIKVYLTTGQWVLVVAVDEQGAIHGAMTVTFINYPNDRVAFVTSTGGKLIINKDSLTQLKAIVQQMGATKIQAAVRPSMAKLLSRTGFYERYITVETKI
jgi:hypothetical protein